MNRQTVLKKMQNLLPARWQKGRQKQSEAGMQQEAEVQLPPPVDGSAVGTPAQATVRIGMGVLDVNMVWVALTLLGWGLLMAYSTTIALPDSPRFSKLSDTHFVYRHGVYCLVALVVGYMAFRIPMSWWKKYAPLIFPASLLLLVLVFVPGVGLGETNGAHRWISVGGLTFQPAEIAKLSVLLYTSDYVVRRQDVVREKLWQAVWPIAVAVGLVGTLLLLGTDLGSFMVVAVIVMGILLLGGINMRLFLIILLLMLLMFGLIIAFSPFRLARFLGFLDAWNPDLIEGVNYQLVHGLIAIGRGGMFGVGLGASVEKLQWLPEAHTDFLMAVIGEEFGFVGVAALVGLFFWLIKRIVHVGRQAAMLGQPFPGLVAQGVAVWIGLQAFIHMGVNVGILPTKGLTLPLMSYGGSALVSNVIALAIVLRVDLENRHIMRAGGGTP